MRTDMFKVIVERPRRWKADGAEADRRRNAFEGPRQLGMRAGYGYRALNENLNPLRRYLRAQVGRPWNKVYSEIASNIDRRNTVQEHIYQHLEQFVAMKVERQGDRLVDLRECSFRRRSETLSQELYVDPRTGLLRVNEDYRSWKEAYRRHERKSQAEIDARRRVIDEFTQLHRLGAEWFEVRLEALPAIEFREVVVRGRRVNRRVPNPRFDVVMKRMTSRDSSDDERERLYGSRDVYAASKRQLSRREKRRHGLDR